MTPSPAQLAARTRSVDETRSLAGALAELTQAGDLILLAGDLGAGKTAFVQGFGRALGVDEPITSPTFTLAQRYEGARVIHHLDVYRLEQLREVLDLGLSELLDEGGVVLVEWGDAVAPVVPADFLEVRLSYGDSDDERRLTFRSVGKRWTARQRPLAEAISPWAEASSPSTSPSAPTSTSTSTSASGPAPGPAQAAGEGGP